MFPVIGLSSEVGSLVRHVKKRLRDGDAYELFTARWPMSSATCSGTRPTWPRS